VPATAKWWGSWKLWETVNEEISGIEKVSEIGVLESEAIVGSQGFERKAMRAKRKGDVQEGESVPARVRMTGGGVGPPGAYPLVYSEKRER